MKRYQIIFNDNDTKAIVKRYSWYYDYNTLEEAHKYVKCFQKIDQREGASISYEIWIKDDDTGDRDLIEIIER